MLALLILLAVPQAADPLAPAREGKLQCYDPNIAAKTCQSIAAYAARPDGSYLNGARLFLAPGVELEVSSPVSVKGAAVCGMVARADLLGGHITRNGKVLSADEAHPMLDQIAGAYGAMGILEKEVCTTYTQAGTQLRAEVSVAGMARPELTQPVIWIDPNDGYTLGTP